MFITTTKRSFEVKDADMRSSLRGLYKSLRSTRDRKEARRQLGKMVQFGLYNSEKVVHEVATQAAAAAA
jgi:hypothetical protein